LGTLTPGGDVGAGAGSKRDIRHVLSIALIELSGVSAPGNALSEVLTTAAGSLSQWTRNPGPKTGRTHIVDVADLGDSSQRLALWKFDAAIWLVLQVVDW
jgi:hypothetical protein